MRQPPKLVLPALLALVMTIPALVAGPAAARTKRSHAAARRAAHRAHRTRTAARAVRPGARRAAPLAAHPAPPPRVHGHPRPARRRERPEAGSATPEPAGSSAAATIAQVLATTCQNTELDPTAANLPQVRAAVLCLINRERAEHGVPPLTPNADLEAAAEGHCAELVAEDYFAHVSPGGETPVDRIAATGYIPGPTVGYVIGENLAWGTYSLSTPASIVAAWEASPGHLANILEARYTETGIGVSPSVPQSLGEGNPGATYAQEFGVIVH